MKDAAPTPAVDDGQLIARMVGGDREAFETLYCLYYPRLIRAVVQIIKSREDAQEIVQDAFLKVWLERERVNPKFSFKAYLFTIVKNRALDYLRRAATTQALRQKIWEEMRLGRNVTEEEFYYEELSRLAAAAITQLPGQRQTVYRLIREEGLSYEEISARLGISKNTVKNHMIEALKDIKRYLLLHTEPHHMVSVMLFIGFL